MDSDIIVFKYLCIGTTTSSTESRGCSKMSAAKKGCENWIYMKEVTSVNDLICISVIHRLMFNNWKQVDWSSCSWNWISRKQENRWYRIKNLHDLFFYWYKLFHLSFIKINRNLFLQGLYRSSLLDVGYMGSSGTINSG